MWSRKRWHFFTSNGIDVKTFDYSEVAINAVVKQAKVHTPPISAMVHNAKTGLPYQDQEFEAVYSHMFFSMNFTHEELVLLFNEVKRVLKLGGLHFFSVRSDKDKFYGKGRQVSGGVYDVNGFEIRLFSKKDMMGLMRVFIDFIPRLYGFQSYNSSIQTATAVNISRVSNSFQSYNSSIQTHIIYDRGISCRPLSILQ